jgi:hypothetical protein
MYISLDFLISTADVTSIIIIRGPGVHIQEKAGHVK